MTAPRAISIAAAFLIFALLLWQWFQPQRDRGYESAGRELIKICSLTQRAHKEVYGFYQLDSSELMRCTAGFPEGYVLYLSRKDVPKSYQDLLPDDSLPYLAQDSYRLLLSAPHRFHKEVIFWTVDQNESPRLRPERLTP